MAMTPPSQSDRVDGCIRKRKIIPRSVPAGTRVFWAILAQDVIPMGPFPIRGSNINKGLVGLFGLFFKRGALSGKWCR